MHDEGGSKREWFPLPRASGRLALADLPGAPGMIGRYCAERGRLGGNLIVGIVTPPAVLSMSITGFVLSFSEVVV